MRPLYLFLTVLFCIHISALAGASSPNFTGEWDSKMNDEHTFSLNLVQTGDQIKGYHNSVTRHGNRLDAALASDGVPSIEGTVVDGVAHVKFKSSYRDSTGEALITIKGKKMEWKILNFTGLHYLPMSEELYRHKGK